MLPVYLFARFLSLTLSLIFSLLLTLAEIYSLLITHPPGWQMHLRGFQCLFPFYREYRIQSHRPTDIHTSKA